MIDLPTALYVISNVSFCCPQYVPDKALRVLFLLDTLSATWQLCLLNDSEGPGGVFTGGFWLDVYSG